MKRRTLILGAGICGLSAGISTGKEIYEARSEPGGICTSYYVDFSGTKSGYCKDEETYRFEMGGGHWIFGADDKILDFINSFSVTKSYARKASVYLPDMNLFVPFPIQTHLSYLPSDIRARALKEILKNEGKTASTFRDALEMCLGETLCNLFFFPFHELYTAGLYSNIAPGENFKSPADINLIVKGAKEETSAVGYNQAFVYPHKGLDHLVKSMQQKCKISFHKSVVRINLKDREVMFQDGSTVRYGYIISTLPLDTVLELAGVNTIGEKGPYTSVLVFNIAAKKGSRCPSDYWVYIPKSRGGFYRVGFYSNVDVSFLPASLRNNPERVSIYVEKAYPGNAKPGHAEILSLGKVISKQLKEWNFISEVETISPIFIKHAYTWEYPDSKWRNEAIEELINYRIHQIGRYGKWKFQGIAESIKDGLSAKALIRSNL